MDNLKQQEALSEPIYFEVPDKKLMYDFDKLSIYQVEGAIEVLQFLQDQKAVIDGGANISFMDKFNSGGYKWRTNVMAFLLLEVGKDEKVKPFDEATFKRNLGSLELMPAMNNETNNFKEMERIVNDFFFKQGLMPTLLKLLQSNESKNFVIKYEKILQVAEIQQRLSELTSMNARKGVSKKKNLSAALKTA